MSDRLIGVLSIRIRTIDNVVNFYVQSADAPPEDFGGLICSVPLALLEADPENVPAADGHRERPRLLNDIVTACLGYVNRLSKNAGAELIGKPWLAEGVHTVEDPKPRNSTARRSSLRGVNGGRH